MELCGLDDDLLDYKLIAATTSASNNAAFATTISRVVVHIVHIIEWALL